MNDKPVFDPDRDRAFRAMIVENARAEKSRPSLRARATLLIGLVIAAILVSGGGVAMALTGIIQIPVAAPAPVEAPTATPTATPTPTPTPTATPATDPEPVTADVSSWIIGFDGVGPIAFGGPMADASAALDTTDLLVYDSGIEDCLSDSRSVAGDPAASLSVDPDTTGTAVGLITVASYVTQDGTQSTAALPATAEGITIGSTGAELLSAYPDLGDWQTRSGEPGYTLDDGAGHRLWFSVDSASDLVQSIALSTPERLPFGGCGD